MTIQKKAVGSRIFFVDNDVNVAFTTTEMRTARKRYNDLLQKKISSR
jgi:hypothetical protein